MNKICVGDFVIGEEERRAVNEVLDSERISEGPKVKEFENQWAEFIGTKHCVLFNSGTSAIMAGLAVLKYYKNIKDKKKVITSPLTYIATVNAIVNLGLEPVFVDVDKETFGITPKNIRELLEKVDDVKDYVIILPVHLMGYSCDMDEINKIAKEYGLLTFEDSAQAHGSLYNGKKTGSLSLLSDFSFYIAHNIQVGEMGAITTNNYEIKRLLKKIKANGRLCDCEVCTRAEGLCPKISSYTDGEDFDPRFTHDLIGYNFKTTEFHAALGIVQLKKADEIIKKRQENVKYLNEGLKEFEHLLQLPKYSDGISYLAYPIVIKNPNKISRKKLRLELEKNNIETRPLFGCIPTQQPAYNYLKEQYKDKLPNAEFLGLNGFYIGCHQYLKQEELDYIIKSFKELLEGIA